MTIQQERRVLVLTVASTVVICIFTFVVSGGDWVTTLFVMPLVASVTYWTFRISARIGRRFAPPPEEPPERPAAPQPTSERPEHARRRRTRVRKRPRGRRRKGEE